MTKIDHDLVGTIEVKKCQEPGCFPQSITYQSSISQIAALATLSKNCEQHFRVSFYFELLFYLEWSEVKCDRDFLDKKISCFHSGLRMGK